MKPGGLATSGLPDGRVLKRGDRVVTYAARGLEPYRGFPQFMRAAARIARERKDVLFVVAGDDNIAYGRRPQYGSTWRGHMLAETGIDPARIVFLGSVDHASLVRLFQVSAALVHLTVPFVLSWSALEAMACGALVVASRTAPVEEVIVDGRNGILTDFFETDALAAQIVAAIDRPVPRLALRRAARATIERGYERSAMLSRQTSILADAGNLARSERFD